MRAISERISRKDFLKIGGMWVALEFSDYFLPSRFARAEEAPTEGSESEPKILVCPVYYWHEIKDADFFESYLYQLISENYHPVTLSQLGTYLSEGEESWPAGKKPVVLTLDDGLLSQYENAVPILRKWSVQATFACMPDWEGDGVHSYMSNEEIKEIAQDWEIASHTFHHPHLPSLRKENLGAWQAEIIHSKTRLEEIVSKEVVSFVYPYGAFDQETKELVAKHYKIAAKTGGGIILRSDQKYEIPRVWQS